MNIKFPPLSVGAIPVATFFLVSVMLPLNEMPSEHLPDILAITRPNVTSKTVVPILQVVLPSLK